MQAQPGYATYNLPPGVKPVYAGNHDDLPPQTAGYVTPQMVRRQHVSVWAVWWNEFWGSLFYAFVGRLFIAASGGSTISGTIPFIYGNALTNGLAYFACLAIFGAVSGGHFNPAITLAVFFIEFATFYFFRSEKIRYSGEQREIAEKEKIEARELRWYAVWIPVLYPLLQFVAFIFAALLIWAIVPGSPRSSPIDLGIPYSTSFASDGQNFGAELLGSFLFIGGFVLLMKLFGSSSWKIQLMRALAFGIWFFVLILAFAPWAGAVWNPGLWLAFAIVSGRFKEWWIFLFPPLIASFVVAIFSWVHWWMSQIPRRQWLKKRRIGGYEVEILANRMPANNSQYMIN